jgi:hypothetical protein
MRPIPLIILIMLLQHRLTCWRSRELIVGELLKLVLVERLFSLTRDKLMKFPAFAWAYTKLREAKPWLEATEAWQAIWQ